ncbi:MAG: hypothetical protein CMO97_04050 [Woeseia sp.]|nr:hypothetical protein [Woeseia sp.]
MKITEIILEGARVPRKKGQPAGSDKHSDLYTDENPKGTIHGLKFATVKDAEKSVAKIKSSGKTHAHKIQAAIAMEQRAKVAGKKSSAAVYRRYINAMKKKTKKMKGETKEAPKGTYFTKTGNLVKGKLTKDAKAKGARQTDPKDKIRKKVPKVTQYNEDEHKEFETDLKLPNGKKMVLQADDPKYVRGIVIRSNKDGSYDSYYWIDHPDNAMAIEIKLDGKSVKKDAKMIHWAYHPELDEHGGIVTKQNATKDVPVGGEYMNMPRLKLGKEGRPPVIKYGKKK